MFYHGTSKAPTPHEGRPASYSNVTAQLRRAPLMPRARSLCSTGCYKWGFQHRVLRGSLRWETRGAQQYHQREGKKNKNKTTTENTRSKAGAGSEPRPKRGRGGSPSGCGQRGSRGCSRLTRRGPDHPGPAPGAHRGRPSARPARAGTDLPPLPALPPSPGGASGRSAACVTTARHLRQRDARTSARANRVLSEPQTVPPRWELCQ